MPKPTTKHDTAPDASTGAAVASAATDQAAQHDPLAVVAATSAPVPQSGGSFIRQLDGSVVVAAINEPNDPPPPP